MKILPAEQIRRLDSYTIQHEPIASVDLMERAATRFTEAVTDKNIRKTDMVMVFCGMGNNGGDGLAIARMLIGQGYLHVSVYIVRHSPNPSKDFEANEKRIKHISNAHYIETEHQVPAIPSNARVIDAILGSGLSRGVDGITAKVIEAINSSGATVYSVDLPSGLFADKPNSANDTVVKSTLTYTFHVPKLSFMFPSSAAYVPGFEVLDIGLDKDYAESLPSNNYYITHDFIRTILKPRSKFSHKGTFGHALICAGSFGKFGAAVLAVKAALRSGAGLVTAHIPNGGYGIMQIANPEAMIVADISDNVLSALSDVSKFSSIGVGPGIGMAAETASFIKSLLQGSDKPIVIDADALNILAAHQNLQKYLSPNSILTPHPGEFKRLVGEWKDDLDKLEKQLQFSAQHKVVVVLKGAHTSIATPDGKLYFNSSGNAGMAKGGSGDVLTGLLTGSLAQGYSSEHAAVIGVFMHGVAGDYAAAHLGRTGMTATDILRYIPHAFATLE